MRLDLNKEDVVVLANEYSSVTVDPTGLLVIGDGWSVSVSFVTGNTRVSHLRHKRRKAK